MDYSETILVEPYFPLNGHDLKKINVQHHRKNQKKKTHWKY